MNTTVCTLFEGKYHIGLATLINSLCSFEYKGDVWVGYRGDLPPWLSQFSSYNENKQMSYLVVEISTEINVNFIFLETDIHFTNYKPHFIRDVKKLCDKDISAICYFDPDIIINKSWSFFENWMSYGVALCEDQSISYTIDHPIRRRREELIKQYGFEIKNSLSTYYNAGFIGVSFSNFNIISVWIELFELLLKEKLIEKQPGWNMKKDTATQVFSRVEDQDILNVAIQLYDGELSTVGPDGMGFRYGFIAMFHFTGQPKPWNRNNLYELFIKGRGPSNGQKIFMKYLRFPICIYPSWRIWLKKLDLVLATIFSRLIG